MNRFYSVPFKTLAVLLTFVLIVIIAAGAVGVILFYEAGIYTRSAAEVYSDTAGYVIGSDAYKIFTDLYGIGEMPGYYRYGVRFEVTDEYGNTLYSDLYDLDYDISYSANFRTNHFSSYEEFSDSAVDADDYLREYLENSKYAEYYPPVTYDDGYYREGYYALNKGYPDRDCLVTAYLITGENWGEYNILCRGIPLAYALRFWIFPIVGVSLIAFVILIVYLMCSAGRRRGQEGVSKSSIDKLPFDLYTAIMAAIVLLFGALIAEASYSDFFVIIVAALCGTVLYLLLITYFMSMAVRIKCGDTLKNTLIYMILAWICRLIAKFGAVLAYIIKRLPFVWKAVMILLAIAVYNIIVIMPYDGAARAVLLLIEFIVLIPAAILGLIALRKIQKGGQELSRGNLDFQIDTKYMTGSLKTFSEDLNSIGEGLSKAVDERMKSERFKTELITNVSHDIKTPLTSIINYVDLIKKEQLESKTMRQYVDVLDRQSSRLKKLIEDLVEASKASTGNVAVDMEKCDAGVVLAQTAGEYDEKLKANRLELLMNIPEEPCYIMADGRHLWRVIDNLMNNICKYAQPNTRVYINIESKNRKVQIVFRNISKYALNISSDELLERFTRGDSSRSTEGSGLGLSIANSLTEIQGGAMDLTVDGDLFKVTLTFDAVAGE